jgi:hypothetical protein
MTTDLDIEDASIDSHSTNVLIPVSAAHSAVRSHGSNRSDEHSTCYSLEAVQLVSEEGSQFETTRTPFIHLPNRSAPLPTAWPALPTESVNGFETTRLRNL